MNTRRDFSIGIFGVSVVMVCMTSAQVEATRIQVDGGGPHASDHSAGGTDQVTVTDLASSCSDGQVLGGTAAGTGVECQTDVDTDTQNTLDQAYDEGGAGSGRTITVDGGNVELNLNDATNDYNLEVDNTTTGAIASAIQVLTSGAGGTFATGLDVSDSGITDGVNLGATTLKGTGAAIDFTEFDVSGATGSVTINDGGDAGQVSVEGTVLDINSLDFAAAGTITTATGTNDLTLDVAQDIILDADGADLYFKDAGTTVATFTNSSTDLTLDLAGGQLYLADADTINIGGVTAKAYNALANSGASAGAAAVAADNDLYVEGDVEIDGTVTLDGATTLNSTLSYGTGGQPKRTIVLTAAGAIVGPSSGFADQKRTDAPNLSYYTLDFDGSATAEKAFWQFIVPDSYTGTTANVTLYWMTSSTTTTNAVKWFVDFQGLGDGATLDAVFAGQGTVTDNPTGTANQVLVTSEIANVTTGWTAGELATVKISRNYADAADTETADAKLLLVKIEWAASAESD